MKIELHSEDYNLVKNISDPGVKMQILTGVRSAAETGWDFSSRHIRGVNNSNIGKAFFLLIDKQ